MKYYRQEDNIIRVHEDGNWEFSGPSISDLIEGIPPHKCKYWKKGTGIWKSTDIHEKKYKQISETEAFIELI